MRLDATAALLTLLAGTALCGWFALACAIGRVLECRRQRRRDRLRRAILAEVAAVAWTGRDLRRRFGDVAGTLATLEACGFIESDGGDAGARIYIATFEGRAWLARGAP